MSPPTGLNPFSKTSGITQTVHNTRAAEKYHGNVKMYQANTTINVSIMDTNLNAYNRFQAYPKDYVFSFR